MSFSPLPPDVPELGRSSRNGARGLPRSLDRGMIAPLESFLSGAMPQPMVRSSLPTLISENVRSRNVGLRLRYEPACLLSPRDRQLIGDLTRPPKGSKEAPFSPHSPAPHKQTTTTTNFTHSHLQEPGRSSSTLPHHIDSTEAGLLPQSTSSSSTMKLTLTPCIATAIIA